jgi:hypothetical protein
MKNKEKLSPQRYVHVHCSSLVTKEIKLGWEMEDGHRRVRLSRSSFLDSFFKIKYGDNYSSKLQSIFTFVILTSRSHVNRFVELLLLYLPKKKHNTLYYPYIGKLKAHFAQQFWSYFFAKFNQIWSEIHLWNTWNTLANHLGFIILGISELILPTI